MDDIAEVEDGLESRAEVMCFNCDAHWIDIYKLTSIKVTQGPKRDTIEDFQKLGYNFKLEPTAYGTYLYACTYKDVWICAGELSAQEGEKTYKLRLRCWKTMLDSALADFYRRFIDLPGNDQQ